VEAVNLEAVNLKVADLRAVNLEVVNREVVLATGPGNPPAVRDWTGNTVWCCSRPAQDPDQLCLGGVVTWTGHRTLGFWPGWNQTAVPTLRFLQLWLQLSF